VLRVRDSGLGIPPAEVDFIFEPFQRGRNAQFIDGTGIGLAAARRVVEQHGGSIAVSSEEGVGSTFSVRLPLAPPMGRAG